MKKIIAGLLCATMMASMLAACGSKSTDTASKGKDGTYTIGICQLVQHPALDAATEGFKDALKDKLGDKVTFDEQNAAGDSATCATICNGFVSSGYDLILANATPALQAATAATADIPIIGTSVTDYATALSIKDWKGTTGVNVTGTSDLAPLDQQAAMVKELFPNAKNVGILYCSAEANSKYQADKVTKYLEDEGYKVSSYTFSDSNDVATVTQTACDGSDVLYIPTDNTAANCTENINNVALAAKVPIIAGEEGICSGCGVATLSIDYYDIGQQAGLMAYEILVNGKNPATMDIQTATKFTKEYNKDICKTLNIDIPDDYVAITKEAE